MKLTMNQIEAFSAVLAVGTATGAASILNTSQPSVSRSIRQMEDATGLRLFDRTKAGLVPTAAALELSTTIEEAFRGMCSIRRTAEAIRKRETKLIRVACLPALSHGFLASAVREFIERHPNVSVSIQSLLSRDVHEAVHKRLVDIGIAAYEVDDPNLSVNRFTTMSEVVLLKSSHPLAQKSVVTPRDLKNEQLILLSTFDPYRSRLENVLDAEDIRLAKLIEVETSAGACALVAEGLGIAVVNPITALEFMHLGLAMRPFSHDLPFVTTLVSGRPGSGPKIVKAFEKALGTQYRIAKGKIAELLAVPAFS